MPSTHQSFAIATGIDIPRAILLLEAEGFSNSLQSVQGRIFLPSTLWRKKKMEVHVSAQLHSRSYSGKLLFHIDHISRIRRVTHAFQPNLTFTHIHFKISRIRQITPMMRKNSRVGQKYGRVNSS